MSDVAGMSFALSLAPTGARCMVPGFESWLREPDRWRNVNSEVEKSSGELAELITAMQEIDERDKRTHIENGVTGRCNCGGPWVCDNEYQPIDPQPNDSETRDDRG